MSKINKIRWRKSDSLELQRVLKNFNAKISRVKKNHPELAEYQPQKITYEEARKKFATRNEFNRYLNSLKRYSQKGVEQPIHSTRGAKFTKWAEKEALFKQRIDNARKTRERKKIEKEPVKIGGKKQDATRAEMGDIKENELKESHKNPRNMSKKEWELFQYSLDKKLNATERLEKKLLMRENYIKGLRNANFLDANMGLEFYIRNVDIDTFIANVETDDTATFLFYKDPQAWEVRAEYIHKTWKTLYDETKGGK